LNDYQSMKAFGAITSPACLHFSIDQSQQSNVFTAFHPP